VFVSTLLGMNGYPGNNAPRIVTNIMDEAETVTGAQGTAYTYDVLNRLRSMQAYAGLDDDNDWNVASALSAYHTRYTYDGNGNITSLVRRGYDVYVDMDSLDYHYYAGTNRLEYVNDAWGGTPLPDIDNQSPGNYTYDPIGNLINDASESIDNITWTVYGKIESVVRATASDSTHLLFSYGSDGNRVRKITVKEGTTDTTWTWYVRDAQGNVMGIYSLDTVGPADTLMLKEHYVYGSSRLGYVKKEVAVLAADTELDSFTRVLGCMNYELSNHLGNVLAVVSDQKIPVDETANDTINYFLPNVLTWSDFYPFGMIMPGRSGGKDYRHGFNGMERDDEVKGTANSLDFGARIYDPRLGRWLSVDPFWKQYSNLSPYAAFANCPILLIDPNGKEIINAATDPEQQARVDAAIELLKQTLPEFFEYMNSLHLSTQGKILTPGDDGYDEAAALNIYVSIADLDGLPRDEELSKAESSIFADYTYVSGGHLQGLIDLKPEAFGARRRDGKLEVDMAYNDLGLSIGSWVEVTEDNDVLLNGYVGIAIEDNAFFIKIDDYVNKPQYIGISNEAKEDASVLAHELGHAEGIVKHYVNYLYHRVTGSEKGHNKGERHGDLAEKREKDFKDKVNKKD